MKKKKRNKGEVRSLAGQRDRDEMSENEWWGMGGVGGVVGRHV